MNALLKTPACSICGLEEASREASHAEWGARLSAEGGERKRIFDLARKAEAADAFDIYRCGSCGSYFIDPPPSAAGLARFYQAYYANARYASKRKKKIARALRRIAVLRLLARGRTFLDAGCNQGYAVEAARRLGLNVTGIDIDADSIARAKAEFGRCEFICADLPMIVARERQFDIVYCAEVIEHFPEPRQFARELAAVTRPGGILFLTTPDAGHFRVSKNVLAWGEVKPPEHLIWLTRRALKRILRDAGFSRVRFLFNFKPGIRAIATRAR